MSLAAVEMKDPPRELRWVSPMLCVMVASAFAIGFAKVYSGQPLLGALSLLYLASYIGASMLLGLAASKMGRSWVYYGLLPALLPAGGALMSYVLLTRFRHSGNAQVAQQGAPADGSRAAREPRR